MYKAGNTRPSVCETEQGILPWFRNSAGNRTDAVWQRVCTILTILKDSVFSVLFCPIFGKMAQLLTQVQGAVICCPPCATPFLPDILYEVFGGSQPIFLLLTFLRNQASAFVIFLSVSSSRAEVMTNIALMCCSSLPAPLDTKSLNGVILSFITVIILFIAVIDHQR